MKKFQQYILLAITILLSHFTLSAQTFEVKYYLSDFTITRGADSLVTVTSKHRSFFAGDLQAPQLPFLSANILCTQGTTECNPVFSYEKEPIATGVLLNTIPPAYPTSIYPTTIDYTPQIARTSQSKPYNYEGVGKMMGYSFARIALSPFEYDYDTRTLYFIKSFVITLNERVPVQKASARDGSTATPPLGNPQVISDIVLNSNEIESMYDIEIPPIKGTEGSLLIVTSEDLKESFMPFVEWKRLKGYKVYLETVEDIYSQYSFENTNQLKIKKTIYEYYIDKKIDYVLLGGDVEIIPTQMCYIQADYKSTTVSSGAIKIQPLLLNN